MRTRDCFVLTSLFLSMTFRLMAAQGTIRSASNTDPAPHSAEGKPPAEMAGRTEERAPLVTFDDVGGWTVEGIQAEAQFCRSCDQKLYDRKWVGKLIVQGKSKESAAILRSASPIPLPSSWDAINFWNYGDGWVWRADTAPWPAVSALIRDSKGREKEIPFTGRMDYTWWNLMNARRGSDDLVPPLSLSGFKVSDLGTRRRELYFGPCYFYEDTFKPKTFPQLPEELPFPTRKETILPLNRTTRFTNSVREENGTVIFAYEGEDTRLEYRYTPATGMLDDLSVFFEGRTLKPAMGARVELIGEESGPIRFEGKGCSLTNGEVKSSWDVSRGSVAATLTWTIRIQQKSLIVDVEADRPVVRKLSLGGVTAETELHSLAVPFLTLGEETPKVVRTENLFILPILDWYVSNASELFGKSEVKRGVCANGGAEYLPKTNGERNCLRERLFINVSPDFQEVLPDIPNPPSPFREDQGKRLWQTEMSNDYPRLIQRQRQMHDYGVTELTIRYHEDTWRSDGASFTFKVHAPEELGGDKVLQDFVAQTKALGWRVGLYSNFTDLAPVNSYWTEDWLLRKPDRSWQVSWTRCYAPKPLIGLEKEPALASEIANRFGPDHSYSDVISAVPPWTRTDYDYRVPGAGMFRTSYNAYGAILLSEKQIYKGPVFSEGGFHWMYAGLTDGNYGKAHTLEPLLPDFNLLKIHPLQMDAGLGHGVFGRDPARLDEYLAKIIAYGQIGELTFDGVKENLKIYYMLQQLQARYAMTPVRSIEYDDNGTLVSTSAALRSGAVSANRLRLLYDNGLEIFVNGNRREWSVMADGRSYRLPTWGYVAVHPESQFLEYSALPLKGSAVRLDYSCSPTQCYFNSGEHPVRLENLGVQGQIALKRQGADWKVIPVPECREFAFVPNLLGYSDTADLAVYRSNGEPASYQREGNRIRITFAGPEILRISEQKSPPN